MADEFSIARMMQDAADFERGRVARQRDFKREMVGTFQQNADLQKQLQGTWQQRDRSARTLQGTWEQNAGLKRDLEGSFRDRAALDMDKARMADFTQRRGQDIASANAQNELSFRNTWDLRNQDTTRRGQDITRELQGYQYPTVKDYNDVGQIIGEHVQPYRLGEPVVKQAPQQGSDWANARWKEIKANDPHFTDMYFGKDPEQQKFMREMMVMNGRTDMLKYLAEEEKKRTPKAGPQSPPMAPALPARDTSGQGPTRRLLGDVASGVGSMMESMKSVQNPGPTLRAINAMQGVFSSQDQYPTEQQQMIGTRMRRGTIPSPDDIQPTPYGRQSLRRPIPYPG